MGNYILGDLFGFKRYGWHNGIYNIPRSDKLARRKFSGLFTYLYIITYFPQKCKDRNKGTNIVPEKIALKKHFSQ